MKIKYKLSLAFTIFLLVTFVPVSIFYVNLQQNYRLDLVREQGRINTEILARMGLQILIASGADVRGARLDAADAIQSFSPFFKEGLRSSSIFIVTNKRNLRGVILADLNSAGFEVAHQEKVAPAELERLMKSKGFAEISLDGRRYYEFLSFAYLGDETPVSGGRMLYSYDEIMKPIRKIQLYIAIIIGAIFVLGIAVSFFAGSLLTRPLYRLIEGVRKTENDPSARKINVGSLDEIGQLGNTFNDYTKVLNLQIRELIRNNRELRRLDGLKDEFIANMSHEIRSPLHGIIGLSESLLAGAGGMMNEKTSNDVSLILSSAQRLTALVNDILDFSRLKHGDITLNITNFDLYTVVRKITEMSVPLFRGRNLKIISEIDRERVFLSADRERIEQILLNLMSNAIKFTSEGEIRVTAKDLPGGYVEISVADSGSGITKENREKIFESFVQGDTTESREYGGAGLGLAIVHHLVTLHGGTIDFESEEGSGTRFFFTVRKGEAIESELEKTESMQTRGEYEIASIRDAVHADYNGNSEGRILIVDDDDINLQILVNILQIKRYEIIIARDGYEALGILESDDAVDLVLLDVMMPKISGYDVCRRIREKFALHELPVVMLTAKGASNDIVTGINSGANDYLVKPVNTSELIARVNNLVIMKRSMKEKEKFDLVRRDIQIAHEIQQSIMSWQDPELDGVSISVRYRPAYELGGDFYVIRKVSDSEMSVLLADVSGHGVAAALICSMLKLAHSLTVEPDSNPAAVLYSLNRSMYEYLTTNFVTVCSTYINLKEHKLITSNGGHCPILILSRNGNVSYRLIDGIPLGWKESPIYSEETIELRPGDRIIFYTDMVIEAKNSSGDLYTLDRFVEFVQREKELSPQEFTDALIDEISIWCGIKRTTAFSDDFTVIVVDIG